MIDLFRPREYHRVKDSREAVSLLSRFDGKARIIAGGTELLVRKPPDLECLIDISRLSLGYLKRDEEGIKIGATATLDSIERSPVLSSDPYRVVSEAAGMLGTPTIRNMATIGGNLCNASPAGDLPPPLMVLGARVKIIGLKGSRTLPVGDFFKDVKETVLNRDELVVEVQIPVNSPNAGAAFQKVRHHQTSSFARISPKLKSMRRPVKWRS